LSYWDKFIRRSLDEDVGSGDHTTLATIPQSATAKAKLLVKQNGIIAGVGLAQKIYAYIDKNLLISVTLNDGSPIKHGDIAFTVEGSTRAILTAERLVLNCLQRMSGIATLTNQFIKAVEGTGVKILDTRKTTPLFREAEKWAVRIGGGYNHRFGLYDMILIKDNHIDACGGIEKAIKSAHNYLKEKNLDLKIEIECRSIDEQQQILSVGKVHRILLDNFTFDNAKQALALVNNKFETELSGHITLQNVRSYAEAKPTYISVGALTHSYSSLDLSLKII
jgi:nicotinate-nucleotide pyrophosphorylase (carboxylating)